MNKSYIICGILAVFATKIYKHYSHQSYNTNIDQQTVHQLQQAQQMQYQQNQPAGLFASDSEGLVRKDAIGLTSIDYKEGYEWAKRYQIINPEWCSNQEKPSDFILGCEDYALEQNE